MKLEIYLPIEHKDAANAAISQCIDAFGGCTVTKGVGHWRNDAGKLYSEPVKVVSIYSDRADDLMPIARQYKQSAKQESVLMAIDGQPQFI